jgi:PAS domain S-box-containing protein
MRWPGPTKGGSTLRTKGLVAILPPLVALLVAGIAFQLSVARERDANKRVAHTLRVLGSVSDVRTLELDALVRARGYALVGDPVFLEEYRDLTTELPGAVAAMRELVVEAPTQQARVDQLEYAIEQAVATMNELVAEVVEPSGSAGDLRALIERSRADRIRVERILDATRQQEERLLATRRAAAERAAAASSMVVLLVLGGGFLFGVLAIWLFLGRVASRIRRLAEAAKRGELPPGLEGTDEVGILVGALHARDELLEERTRELRESEEHYRMLASNLPGGAVALFDRDLRFLVLEGRLLAEIGIDKATFEGKLMSEAPVTPGLHQQLERIMREALEGKESAVEMSRGDRFGVLRTVPAGWEGETVTAGLLVTMDITDQKRAEQEATEQAERVADLYNEAPVAYHSLGPDGTYLEVNDTELRWLGYERDEVVGKMRFEELLTDEDRAVFAERFSRFVEEGEAHDIEYELLRRDGSVMTVLLNSTAVTDEEDRFVQSRTSMVDITERRRAQDALRENEAFLESVVENVPAMIFVKEAEELRFVRFNRAGEELLGYRREDLLGKNDFDFFPEEEATSFVAKDREVLEGGTLLDIPEEPIHTTSGVRILHTRKVPIPGADGRPRHLLGISEDITESREQQDQLRLAKEEAERANRAKDEFLSRMSHELRTPMNSVLGFAQLLEMDDDLAGEHRDSVHHILRAGTHLVQLIDDILDLSRIASGRLSISAEPVPVTDLLRESADIVRPLAAERGIRMRVEDANGLHVLADRQRLKQVLLNLLTNAIKYNLAGGDVAVSWEKGDEGTLRVHVADTGPGIPDDRIDRVFLPFDRLGAEGSDVPGAGLGLSLSKSLVEAMGGELTVRSEPDVGTTFTVHLTLAERPIDRLARQERTQDAGARPLVSGTVLYIEDNLANLALVEHVLDRRAGVSLLTTMQGRLGIELARQHRPDLILLDVHLPDMTGHDVLREIREDVTTRDIPVVVVSADATVSSVKRLLANGAADYVTKPIDVARFLEILDRTLVSDPR